MDTVPVLWVDVDNARAVKILLADNRTNDLAGYDNKALTELLSDISNTDGLEGTGYDEADLDALIAELAREQSVQTVNGEDDEWVGMPDYEPYKQSFRVTLHCDTAEVRAELLGVLSETLHIKAQGEGQTISAWYPHKDRALLAGARVELSGDED